MTDTIVSDSVVSNNMAANHPGGGRSSNSPSAAALHGGGGTSSRGGGAMQESASSSSLQRINTVAMSDLMAAIEMLPHSQKSSFFKAKQTCPDLIEHETNPALFLKFDKYNYWKAAERLARHWTLREKYFGERAFLPMTCTGNGALTKQDIVTLHTGSHALLPNAVTGQQVCFTDRRRILASSTRESRARCFWYFSHMLTKDETAQTDGIAFLVLLVTPRPTTVDLKYMQQGFDTMNAMPAIWHMHVLNCVSKTGKWAVARKLIQSVVSKAIESFGGMKVFTESCKDELMEKLKALGCTPEGLPSSVGGVWQYEEYTKFLRQRVMEELYFEESHLPKNNKIDTTARKGNMTDEHKKERTKSLNVIHSRQKRERREEKLSNQSWRTIAIRCKRSVGHWNKKTHVWRDSWCRRKDLFSNTMKIRI